VKCGVISTLIAKKVGYRELHCAFTCGFLHDIGKLALLNLPERYTRPESYSDQEALFLASEMFFGITHSKIGASLLHQWKLETFMADAVLYHHQPKERVIMALPLVKMVYVANGLSQASIEKQEEGCKAATEIFNFSKVDLEELLRQSDNQLREMGVLLGIEIEVPRGLRKTISVNDLKTVQDSRRKLKTASFLLKTLHSLTAASDQNAIFKQIRGALRKIFKVETGLIFLHDIERNELVGKIVGKDDKLSESRDLSVPLRAQNSLLVKTLRQGKPFHSFRQPPEFSSTIIDEQVIRFVGKEGILCLPLIAGGEHIGVIVIGLDEGELSRLSKHVNILTMLSNQAAVPFHRDILKKQNLKTLKSQRIRKDKRREEKRRRHTRKPCSLPVHYATDDETFMDYVRDISEGGAFLETTFSFFAVGEQIRMVFAPRNSKEAIKVTAEVVWCRLDGVGVKFTNTSKNLQSMIKSL
jgi:Tfp pilus assembly protein PilZ